jgi:hypothetical protein
MSIIEANDSVIPCRKGLIYAYSAHSHEECQASWTADDAGSKGIMMVPVVG